PRDRDDVELGAPGREQGVDQPRGAIRKEAAPGGYERAVDVDVKDLRATQEWRARCAPAAGRPAVARGPRRSPARATDGRAREGSRGGPAARRATAPYAARRWPGDRVRRACGCGARAPPGRPGR